MSRTRFLATLTLILLSLPPLAAAETVGLDACAPFYRALETLPRESLFQRAGPYTSNWFGAGAIGCQVVLVTSEQRLDGRRLPDLTAAPGTPLHRTGWRANPAYVADGPGSGVFGVEKANVLCLVYSEQPAWIDDAGRHRQSSRITVRVECMASEQAPIDGYTLRRKQGPQPSTE